MQKYKEVVEFIELLGLTQDEVLRAMLSAFASVQPGPIRQSWMRAKDYGEAPETAVLWEVLVHGDFKCVKCGTHYDITVDHIDKDNKNNSRANFRVLCRDCNREVSKRGLKNRHANLRVYRAFMKLYKQDKNIPSPNSVRLEAGLEDLSGSLYLVRFLQSRLGAMTPIRHYKSVVQNPKYALANPQITKQQPISRLVTRRVVNHKATPGK